MYGKSNNTRIAKILYKRREFEESNPRYRIERSIQDLHNLEKYYVDVEYRNSLVSAQYPSLEYFELENIFEQEAKVKAKSNNSPSQCLW